MASNNQRFNQRGEDVRVACDEIAQGSRFAFGENWGRFLRLLNDERIEKAEQSLTAMMECDDLSGRTFLDVGSGSGLFSLAARRLKARVHSFDFFHCTGFALCPLKTHGRDPGCNGCAFLRDVE